MKKNKRKIRNALYLAGTILVTAALLTQFKNANLIWSTILVAISIVLLVLGFNKDKELVKACLVKKPSKKKIAIITVGVMAVFFGLGFAVGKLIYLWSHLE